MVYRTLSLTDTQYTNVAFETDESVLFIEVSLIERGVLNRERCP